MRLSAVSTHRYKHTMFWALLLCCLIIGVAATLARASYNFSAALTDKPDLALYLLLPKEQIGYSSLLKDKGSERDYLAQTKDGPKLVILKKGTKQWYVASEENLH